MASIVLSRPPRFYLTYRRLFNLLSRRVQRPSRLAPRAQKSFDMEGLTGYPDLVLFQISEICVLGCFKDDESQSGASHDMDMWFRTDVIRRQLCLWMLRASTSDSAEDRRKQSIAKIWNETVGIYLDSILNNFNFGMSFFTSYGMALMC